MAQEGFINTLDEYATVNKVNTLNDSIKGAAKTAKQASTALKALTEVLKVNPEDLKKALIMGALKDAAEGKEVTYEGNFYKDLLELVEGLQKENERLKQEQASDQTVIKDLRYRIEKAEEHLVLRHGVHIDLFKGNGWVSKRKANDAIMDISNIYEDIISDAWRAL